VSRRSGILGCLAAAVLVGGVAQAWAWRIDMPVLPAVLNTQFAWAVILYAAGWVGGAGRSSRGLVWGAVTGGVLIASYYLCQALADGSRSAVDQFVDGRGIAWAIATVGVGAALGVLGSWAVHGNPRLAAFSLLTMALFLIVAPVALLVLLSEATTDGSAVVVVYGLVGLVLAVTAFRRAGLHAAVVGGLGAVVAGLAAIGVLVTLLRSVLYVTF
jgi:hypothetical protein